MGLPYPRRRRFAAAILGVLMVFLAAPGVYAPSPAAGQGLDPGKLLEACQTIEDAAIRLRCFENATSNLAGPARPSPTASQMDGWRLVRTPNPAGGPDAVSVMRTPDLNRSDRDFAGLMIRCSATGEEALIAVISPFPLRAHPRVILDAGGRIEQLQASVVPPGAALLLPGDARAMVAGPWRSLPELSVDVSDGETRIRGVVSLLGLPAAIQAIAANCGGR